MVLHFNSRQRLSSSPSRGDIHPKTQLSVSRLVHGPIRAALRRFPQTSSTLAPLPAISLAFLLSLLVPPPNSGAQEVNIDQTAPRSLKQLSLPARCATWPGGWPILGQMDQAAAGAALRSGHCSDGAGHVYRSSASHRGGLRRLCFQASEFQIAQRTARTLAQPHGAGSPPAINHARPPGLITPLARSIKWLEGKLGSASFLAVSRPATGRLAASRSPSCTSTEA